MKDWMGNPTRQVLPKEARGPSLAQVAHLDPVGFYSHLVYPTPALHANPLSRGVPHVGASGGHVSAPPSPGARVVRPLPDTRARWGRCGVGSPAPSRMPGPGESPGRVH